jgi:hypothetical protein
MGNIFKNPLALLLARQAIIADTYYVVRLRRMLLPTHNSLTINNLKPQKATSKTRSGFFDEKY